MSSFSTIIWTSVALAVPVILAAVTVWKIFHDKEYVDRRVKEINKESLRHMPWIQLAKERELFYVPGDPSLNADDED